MQQSNPAQPGCGPTPAERRFHTAKAALVAAAAVRAERLTLLDEAAA